MDGVLGLPQPLPQFLRLLPEASLGPVHMVVLVRCIGHAPLLDPAEERILSPSCFPFLLPRKESWLFLGQPGLPWARDSFSWGAGTCSAENDQHPEVSLCSVHSFSPTQLTSLPSASSLLLTCLLTCTDQLYQQLEQNTSPN